jgi:hypothetical protein
MMSLQTFELRDHYLARWDQRVTVLARESARHKDPGKSGDGDGTGEENPPGSRRIDELPQGKG